MIVAERNNDLKSNTYWYKSSISLTLLVYSFLVSLFISVHLKSRRNLALKYDIYHPHLNSETASEVQIINFFKITYQSSIPAEHFQEVSYKIFGLLLPSMQKFVPLVLGFVYQFLPFVLDGIQVGLKLYSFFLKVTKQYQYLISKGKSSNEITNVWISFISNLHHLFLLNKSCLKNIYTGVENDATHPHVTNVEIFSRIASTEISANIEIIVLDDSGNDISC